MVHSMVFAKQQEPLVELSSPCIGHTLNPFARRSVQGYVGSQIMIRLEDQRELTGQAT